jgi:outer membrane translocation and assembly module TamA
VGRLQVAGLQVQGSEQLRERPLLSCLVTRERPRFGLTLGLSSASCGAPPFDSQAPRLNLWRWWWTDWPAFNHAVFEADLEKIVRWYRARGYYDARVVTVSYDPPEAEDPNADLGCDIEEDVCPVKISITIEEGQPTLLRKVVFLGVNALTSELQARVRKAGALELGQPIDEHDYDERKQSLLALLQQAGYAAAEVEGEVRVNTAARSAEVEFKLDPGELYRFGNVSVEGHGSLPEAPILAAARMEENTRYSPQHVREVQSEVYALGAFSSVQIHEEPDAESRRVHLRLEVTPHSPHALRVGFGVLSGSQQRTSTGEMASIPQWDLHIFGRYERRHVFGTLGRFSIEERPRMIFSEDFPRLTPPKFGNIVKVRLNQPGLLERRTDLFTENAWDYGPDPFLGFQRSDIYFRLGARRGFWRRRMSTTLAVQQDLFLVEAGDENVTSDGSELPSTYGYSFVEQDLRLDLRDNPLRPRWGAYLGFNATEAPLWAASDWTAYRLAPEARAYVPFFWDIIWANRFAVSGLFITGADPGLDATSQQLGPSTYRLRGGGANSNRGFLAGTLGVGVQGGIRRWEASSELRIPFGQSFVLAGFADVGDVNDQEAWRWDHLNLTLGWGLRFYTILGAIRLDVGLRVPSLQRADGSDGIDGEDSEFLGAPGALHLTIGDPF